MISVAILSDGVFMLCSMDYKKNEHKYIHDELIIRIFTFPINQTEKLNRKCRTADDHHNHRRPCSDARGIIMLNSVDERRRLIESIQGGFFLKFFIGIE